MNILITGANGFVGQYLCDLAARKGINTCALVRRSSPQLNVRKQYVIQDFLIHTEWKDVLKGRECVIHTAGLAHVSGRREEEYYAINTYFTEKLALECVKYGVKRFVYVSSLYAAFGGHSALKPLTLQSPCTPKTPYGKSKLFAEEKLQKIAVQMGLEVIIVRPPLVYGPHVAANVRTLVRAIQKKIPFPFAGVNNQRDMVYVENLADALITCAVHPAAKSHTFFVSDGNSLSIVELIEGLARGMDITPRFFYLPKNILRFLFKVLRKEEILEKITGSLQVDGREIQNMLGWTPPFSYAEGLEKTGSSFCTSRIP